MKQYKQPKSLEKAIIGLPSPAAPLTGKGFKRVAASQDIVGEIAEIAGGFVNAGRPEEMQGLHFATTYSRASGKWGKSTPSYWLSPEMSNLINENKGLMPFVGLPKSERRRLREEQKMMLEQQKRLLEQRQQLLEQQKRLRAESRQQRYEANNTTLECDSTEILKVFFENEVHPAPEHVVQAKNSLEKSWGSLRKAYHA